MLNRLEELLNVYFSEKKINVVYEMILDSFLQKQNIKTTQFPKIKAKLFSNVKTKL